MLTQFGCLFFKVKNMISFQNRVINTFSFIRSTSMNHWKLKNYIFLCLLFFSAANLQAQPSINSFAPTSGSIGRTVIISGTNFSATASNNIVYFGSVRASVVTASSSSLSVVVPVGATFQPISVTTNNLTAYSSKPFIVTFPGGNIFSPNSFDPKVDFSTGSRPQFITFGDLDGDGKSDMIVANSTSNTISIFKNTSTVGSVSFTAKTDYPTGSNPVSLSVGDLDGDGKPDVAVVNSTSNTLSVFRNTGTPGTISLAVKVDYPTGNEPYGVAIGDLNNDGKPDIVVANYSSNTISAFKNIGAVGAISFAVKVDFTTGAGPNSVSIGDIDGDGKPDITVPNNNANTVSILRNVSSSGTITLASKVDFPTGAYPFDSKIGDFDDDGKLDVAVANGNVATISIFRNLSTTGNVSMASKMDFGAGSPSYSVFIDDLNGDGKPDIAAANSLSSSLSVLENRSTAGSLSLASKVDYPVGSSPYSVSCGDLDGDGKSDIAAANFISNTISVLRNKVTGPYISSFTPTLGGNGSTVIITGNNFAGTNAVSFGGTAAASFSVDSSTSITALVSTGASGSVSVTTPQGNASLAGFTFSNVPTITSFNPERGGTGTTVVIRGTNFIGAISVSFGGSAASSFVIDSANKITAVVGTVSTGTVPVSVTTPYGTASRAGFYTGPTITAFTPMSGAVGTTVTISGTHFSNVASANIVFFGAVKAQVTSASATSLSVIVPYGATFEPITVNTGNLIAYSEKPFIVTFAGGDAAFNANSFAPQVDSPSANSFGIVMSDLDMDGRPDIAAIDLVGNQLSVFKNTGSQGVISFAKKIDYATGAFPFSVCAGDLDGDGKPELVTVNNQSNSISVFYNTSTAGAISFTAKTDYTTYSSPDGIALQDLNGDGKPDIIVANSSPQSVSVFINTGTPGNLSFAPQAIFFTGSQSPNKIAISDLDGDGKPDVAIAGVANTVTLLRNTTSGGVISFALPINMVNESSGTIDISIGDLDGDGKPDIILANSTNNAVSVFRNISTPGTISFSPRIDFTTDPCGCSSSAYPNHIGIGDVNGDGKPDIVALLNNTSNSYLLFRNISTNGNIAFDSRVDYTNGSFNGDIVIGDLDGDGKPDLAFATGFLGVISVSRNKIGEGTLCANGNGYLTANLSGTVYQWQVNSGSGFININDNTNYQGTHTRVLLFNNIPSAWYNYQYRCVVDNVNDSAVTIRFVNKWTGSSSSAWENPANWSCGTVPDSNTDVVISSGTAILNSNTSVRSLTLNAGVSFTVASGYTLIITH